MEVRRHGSMKSMKTMKSTRSRKSTKSTKSTKSSVSIFRNEEVKNFIVVPPDGGWGWVVVAAGFGCNLMSDGIMYTFGIFLTELSKEFNMSVGKVTITGSLQTLSYYLVGPFVSALVNRFGFRCVVILGSFLAASGFALGSFLYDFNLFVVSAGVLTGLGFGMISIPTVIICGFYFEKWRALATGMATCGAGIGTLIIPPCLTYLLENFAWRNTYRILAGLILCTSLLALCYRPLKPINAIHAEKTHQIYERLESLIAFAEDEHDCCTCRKHHNIYYPTTHEFIPVESVILQDPEASDDENESTETGDDTEIQSTQKLCSPCCEKLYECCTCVTTSRPMYRDDIFFVHSLKLLPQYLESIAHHKNRKHVTDQETEHKHKLQKTHTTRYHMAVTRVTTQREILAPRKTCPCSLAMLRTLATMLDLRLLTSPAFQLFSWSGTFMIFGFMTPYLYIKDRAVDEGISPHLAVWLLSAIGAANTVGRIVSGALPSVTKKIKVIEYSYVCIAVAGIMTAASGYWMRIEFQFFYACIYGIAGSCIATLRPVIVVELFGLEHLTNAFGLQLMFMAVSGFFGTVISGMIYDKTNNYNMSFLMSGGCLIFASFLLVFIRKVRAIEKKKNWCKI